MEDNSEEMDSSFKFFIEDNSELMSEYRKSMLRIPISELIQKQDLVQILASIPKEYFKEVIEEQLEEPLEEKPIVEQKEKSKLFRKFHLFSNKKKQNNIVPNVSEEEKHVLTTGNSEYDKILREFQSLTEKGKIYFVIKMAEYYKNKLNIIPVQKLFAEFIPSFNNHVNITDNIILDIISKDEEAKQIVTKLILMEFPISTRDLKKTNRYLLSQGLLSKEWIFDKMMIDGLNLDDKKFIIDNIDKNNLLKILTTYRRNKDDKYFDFPYLDFDYSRDMHKIYEEISKSEGYDNLIDIIKGINGRVVNFADDEIEFLMYIIYCYDRKQFIQPHEKNAFSEGLLTKNKIELILSKIIHGELNLTQLQQMFQIFSHGVFNYKALDDTFNFALKYYHKPIYQELLQSGSSIRSDRELLDKINYLAKNNALMEIYTLESLKKSSLEDLSKMHIDLNVNTGTQEYIRYHPFQGEGTRQDRSLYVISKDGTYENISVNGHDYTIKRLYPEANLGESYADLISRSVQTKDDVLVLSAGEFVDIFFDNNITGEQLDTLHQIVARIGDKVTYVAGICGEEHSVTPLTVNDDTDTMTYQELLEQLDRLSIPSGKVL